MIKTVLPSSSSEFFRLAFLMSEVIEPRQNQLRGEGKAQCLPPAVCSEPPASQYHSIKEYVEERVEEYLSSRLCRPKRYQGTMAQKAASAASP